MLDRGLFVHFLVTDRENIVLDLDHPQSAHVFAAAKQIDLILDYAKRISFDQGHGRHFMTHVVAPCFAALQWLNENHFNNDEAIRQRIVDLQSALGKLSASQITSFETPTERMTCPVCKHPLTQPSQYDSIPYCSVCLDMIIPALTRLESCEGGFGTEAI